MSESTGETEREVRGQDDGADGDVEERARRMGWRPREEYTGDPAQWRDADEYLKRGYDAPGVLVERYNRLDRRFADVERELRDTRERLTASATVTSEMVDRLRSADERALARARRELEAQRDAAVDVGDRAAVARVQAEIDDLNRSAVPPAQTESRGNGHTPPPVPGTAPGSPPPEVQAFFRDNPWYFEHADLRAEADALYTGFNAHRPQDGVAANLQNVRDRMARLYPDRVRPAFRRTEASPGVDDGAREPPPPRQRRNARSFDTMPPEAKSQFDRWNRALQGKGSPLTKEEFAKDYWDQFPEG